MKIKILLAATVFTLVGCNGNNIKPDQLDAQGIYSGEWLIHISLTQARQRLGQWIYTCSPREFTLIGSIENGRLTIPSEPNTEQAESAVGSNGALFYSQVWGVMGSYDAEDMKSYLVLKATLGDKQGVGNAYFARNSAGAGCSADLTLEKIN